MCFTLKVINFLLFLPTKGVTGGSSELKEYIEERAVDLANFIIENKATVRAAAKKFGISKSTVHME